MALSERHDDFSTYREIAKPLLCYYEVDVLTVDSKFPFILCRIKIFPTACHTQSAHLKLSTGDPLQTPL